MSDLSKIRNIDELNMAKARLAVQIERKRHHLDKSFIIAKRHTKDTFTIFFVLRNTIGRIFSIDRFMTSPQNIFKIGTAIGKKVAWIFKRKRDNQSHLA